MATPPNRQPARLCDRCNANMDEIRKLVGNFSPVNQVRISETFIDFIYMLSFTNIQKLASRNELV